MEELNVYSELKRVENGIIERVARGRRSSGDSGMIAGALTSTRRATADISVGIAPDSEARLLAARRRRRFCHRSCLSNLYRDVGPKRDHENLMNSDTQEMAVQISSAAYPGHCVYSHTPRVPDGNKLCHDLEVQAY